MFKSLPGKPQKISPCFSPEKEVQKYDKPFLMAPKSRPAALYKIRKRKKT